MKMEERVRLLKDMQVGERKLDVQSAVVEAARERKLSRISDEDQLLHVKVIVKFDCLKSEKEREREREEKKRKGTKSEINDECYLKIIFDAQIFFYIFSHH